MTKLTVVTVLAIVYLCVVRFAQFLAAMFFILFFGATVCALLRNLKPAGLPHRRQT
jgi:hypothetical protein